MWCTCKRSPKSWWESQHECLHRKLLKEHELPGPWWSFPMAALLIKEKISIQFKYLCSFYGGSDVVASTAIGAFLWYVFMTARGVRPWHLCHPPYCPFSFISWSCTLVCTPLSQSLSQELQFQQPSWHQLNLCRAPLACTCDSWCTHAIKTTEKSQLPILPSSSWCWVESI